MVGETPSAALQVGTGHRFLLLDALRGLAAILIVQRHTYDLFGIVPLGSTYLSVDLFFLLSGFVVAHAYGDRLKAGYGLGRFAIDRGIRLFPTYWLGLALALFVALSGGVHDGEIRAETVLASLALNVLFLPVPAWLAFTGPFILGQTWSLFAEVVSNILYGLLGKFLTVPVILLFMLCGAGIMIHTGLTLGHLDEGFSYAYMHVGIGRMLYSFFAGVLIYRFKYRILRWIRPSAWLSVLITILALGWPAGDMQWLHDLAVTFLILPLAVMLGWPVAPGPVGKAVSMFLGAISYPLYVIHVPVIEWITAAFPHASGRPVFAGEPMAAILFLACLILLSYIIATFFDAPLRRFLKARIGAKKARPAAGPVSATAP